MCNNLAKQGFNIVCVSRNKVKIDEEMETLKKAVPGCETMTIVADFSKMLTMKDYQETIADKLKDMDVGFLAVNAGIVFPCTFMEHNYKQIEDILNVNATHGLYMTKCMASLLTDRFDKTGKRSGLVIMSSASALAFPFQEFGIYSGVKSFTHFIG